MSVAVAKRKIFMRVFHAPERLPGTRRVGLGCARAARSAGSGAKLPRRKRPPGRPVTSSSTPAKWCPLRLNYTTLGEPAGEPVLILHGTTGSGSGLLSPGFGGELFGPGQPLDAAKYFIILPDAIGHGKSAKPSDGLRAKFPRYNYDDMVAAQYRLVTEGLGVKHLRLVLGNSMGVCTPGCGARNIPTSWMRWCRWQRSLRRCRAATGSQAFDHP